MLKNSGNNISNIDPKKIKLYGHHGAMLPEAISEDRFDDLPENAIHVEDGNDGVFNESDYILFYGQSPHKWKYDPALGRFVHQTNIYSDKTYYFLTFEGANGKRMSTQSDEII
ncbi:MAG: hypothetical protein R2852_05120 [Bacteroidia bacterium]